VPPSDGRRSVPLPAEPAEPATRHRAVAALLLAVLSLVGLLSLNYLQRGIYLVAYALLAGLMAMWLALTALARARRSRTARPRGSVTATVIAGVGIILSAIMLLAFVTFGQQLNAYGRCLSEASTSANRQACQNQFIHAVNHEIAAFRKSGSG
jgi:amino acid transporter